MTKKIINNIKNQIDEKVEKRIGVILINTGTPQSYEVKDVKKYLAEFLADYRIIELPKFFWIPILQLVLFKRSPCSAAIYKKIWLKNGQSPLLHYTNNLAKQLNEDSELNEANVKIVVGMNYGQPSIKNAINNLLAHNVKEIILLPMYPQYSSTTVGSSLSIAFKYLAKLRNIPTIRTINSYYDNNLYINAIANSIIKHDYKNRFIIFSYHGIPKRYSVKGDLYYEQCFETTKLLVEKLFLDKANYQMCFQSRFGPEEWLKPYLTQYLKDLAKREKDVIIINPGFAMDCIETIDEIAQEAKEDFLSAGGEKFTYIECLNDNISQIGLMKDLIKSNIIHQKN